MFVCVITVVWNPLFFPSPLVYVFAFWSIPVHSTRTSQRSGELQRLLQSLHSNRTSRSNTLGAKAAACDDLARSLGQARVEEGSIAAQALDHALQLRGVEEQVQLERDALRHVCWQRDRLVQRLARQQRALAQVMVHA